MGIESKNKVGIESKRMIGIESKRIVGIESKRSPLRGSPPAEKERLESTDADAGPGYGNLGYALSWV